MRPYTRTLRSSLGAQTSCVACHAHIASGCQALTRQNAPHANGRPLPGPRLNLLVPRAAQPSPPSFPARGAAVTARAVMPSTSSSSTPAPPSKAEKAVWLQTTNPAAAAAGLEAGLDTLVFGGLNPGGDAAAWGGLATFNAVLIGEGRADDGACALIDGATGGPLGWQHPLPDAAAAAALATRLGVASPSSSPSIVWAAPPPGAWSLIPTENLVAATGGGRAAPSSPSSTSTRLFVSATTAGEAAGLLGALGAGADGVVLVTDDPAVARAGGRLLVATRPSARLFLVPALVTAAAPAGMGDRVCVDLTTAMAPGEGLLVGSFARGLALVQAEVESGAGYVATRPFRVNAGALHSYVAAPGGRTAYLAELGAGDEVLVVDGGTGATRTGVVGRAKVERRPLIRVTLAIVSPAGRAAGPADTLSLILQNAETVRLVGPSAAPLPPAAAEVVRWVKEGGGGSDDDDGGVAATTTALRRSDSEALRWAMHSTDSSSDDEDGEDDEGGGGPAAASPPPPSSGRPDGSHAPAAPDARDALAWLMRDQGGDGHADGPGVGGTASGAESEKGKAWKSGPAVTSTSTPVSSLLPSVSAVWVWRGPAARHTGLEVEEDIEER